ncbi:MAG: alpha/beta fold hydrolase [Gammaproteobacteria bacterium]|nr:alpha/beta fold hydrolase [Gammaproteobacteria bacterium]
MKLSIQSPNGRLAANLDLPENRPSQAPTVIACHGFGGAKESGKILLLSQRLANAGIATLRFDFSGHGEPPHNSEGDIDTFTISRGVNDLKAVIDFAIEHSDIDQQNIGFYGTSIGANVLLWALADHFSNLDREISIKSMTLLAPLADLVGAVIRNEGENALKHWQQQGFIEEKFDERVVRWHYDAIVDAQSKDTYQLAKNIKTPTLLIHGSEDQSVPVEQSQKLIAAMGQHAVLNILDGVGHRFATEVEKTQAIELAVAYHLSQIL